MNTEHISVIGAGPAGLTAAINLANNGWPVTVYELKQDVGTRFNGDYQGIENWSTEEDAHKFMESIGIAPDFRFAPYAEGDFFNPGGEKYNFRMSRPLFYLVERGTSEWSLDQGLKRQALEAGVQFEWGKRMSHAPDGKVIISTGPHAADAVARGMVFNTSHENYYAAFLDDEIAPQGYAYLLVNEGKATFATCLFEKFSEAFSFFDAALDRMQQHVDININDPESFGGYINFSLNQQLMKDHRIYYVGESAGFQDFLFGFGMRYAMHSGYLAAQSIMEGLSYPDLCEEHIIPKMETSLANRWLFTRLENLGYTIMLDRLKSQEDIMPMLQNQYNPSWYKRTILPMAKRAFKTRLEDKQCMHQNCSCVWCRHGEHIHAEVEC
jgi:flavin-dependent dehydrogenase